jgi:hypothetical protein
MYLNAKEDVKFIENHQPKHKKCQKCGGNFSFNQDLSNMIKHIYRVKCLFCSQTMILKEITSHLNGGCKIELSLQEKVENQTIEINFLKEENKNQKEKIKILEKQNEILQEKFELQKEKICSLENNFYYFVDQLKEKKLLKFALYSTGIFPPNIKKKNIISFFFFNFQFNFLFKSLELDNRQIHFVKPILLYFNFE